MLQSTLIDTSSYQHVLEAIPCMAFLLAGGSVVAMNDVAAAATGFERNEAVQVEQLFLGAYPAETHNAERDFDCVLVRRGQHPVAVRGARRCVEEGVTLVVAQERAGEEEQGQGTFLGDLLDSAPEAIAIAHQGKVLHVNREFTRLFGFGLEDAVGQELDALLLPDGRDYENEILEHLLERDGRAWLETVRRTQAGERIDVSMLMAPVRLAGATMGRFHTFRDIRREKAQQARLHHDAMHDALTGLANRALFMDRLRLTVARLRRRPDRSFTVLFVDLDGFKGVNDSLGHDAGDFLLRETARVLGECVRPQDTVARFGGDEFAVMLDETAAPAEAERVAERMLAGLRAPMLFEGNAIRISGSIGIAFLDARCRSAETALRQADHAMYEAKAAGKSRYALAAGEGADGVRTAAATGLAAGAGSGANATMRHASEAKWQSSRRRDGGENGRARGARAGGADRDVGVGQGLGAEGV